MKPTNNYQILSPTSTGQSHTPNNAPNAALLGASSAFSKPPVKPKPVINTYTGTNGALAAATKAESSKSHGRHESGSMNSPDALSYQNTGGSARFPPSPAASGLPSSPLNLGPPKVDMSSRSLSPSNIAATLAAARHSPIAPKPSPVPLTTRGDMSPAREEVFPPRGAVGSAKDRLGLTAGERSHSLLKMESNISDYDGPSENKDESSIPPTNTLISHFEKNRPSVPPLKLQDPVKKSQGIPPPIKSPKPRRVFSIPSTGESDVDGGIVTSPESIEPPAKSRLAAPPPKPTKKGNTPGNIDVSKSRNVNPSPPASPRRFAVEKSPPPREPTTPNRNESKQRPDLPPPRRGAKQQAAKPSPLNTSSANVVQTPPSSSRPETIRQLSVPPEFSPRQITPSRSPYQRESLRQITSHMTGDSLADAIVSAALASSRVASPALSPASSLPPPLPQRHSHSSPHGIHHYFHTSRTPSPSKVRPGGLRQTLRKESSSLSDEEDEPHRRRRKAKRFLGHKHPNKHSEGTRKRWRNIITERERKRYEGVWAANRGMLLDALELSAGALQDEVANLVTRDIWTRSRLPVVVLEEVWELVDGRNVGRLRREEFVVGMWLIDQALKGRKLPVKVSDSVWASVKGVGMAVKVSS